MIFVDTSFWVALTNTRDGHHAEATTLLHAHEDARLLTSNDVRGETWTSLRRRAGHAAAVRFIDSLNRSPRVEIVRVSEPSEREAEDWLRRRDEREFSWVDATSFATMRQLRITDACAFDGDFSAAGFVEVRA